MEKATLSLMNSISSSRPMNSISSSRPTAPLLPSSIQFPPSSLTTTFSHFPSSSHSLLRRPPSLNCSITDGNISSSASKVSATDPSLAVKKKAADVSPELKGTSIFLIGIKSSLKTGLGELLADTLRYYYFDSDNLVQEAIGGASAAKSFKESDEKGFRESETEVLKQLSSMGRLVVCAGNGAVRSSTNLGLLRHGISLWIDVPLDMVAQEIVENQSEFASFEISASGSHSQVMAQLSALYDDHTDGYATADAAISLQKLASRLGYDMDDITREDMTLEVLKEIERLTRVKKMMEEAARPF